MNKGVKIGLGIAVAIAVVLAIVVIFLAMTNPEAISNNMLLMGLGGGVFLILGIVIIIKAVMDSRNQRSVGTRGGRRR